MWADGPTSITGASLGTRQVAGSYAPVATVDPESIQEVYPEPFRTRAEPTRVNGTRVVRHDRLRLERWDVSNVLLYARLRVM